MDFQDSNYADLRDPKSWKEMGGAVACVLCAALAAGLTVGLMSLDPLELEVKRRVGTADERRHAEKICPLISRHHRLLVTLLLFNSLANEALPIFLAELVPPYVAVLLSVTAILIFGEIIPSALFTGPQQIVMAARLSSFVYVLMGLFYPIAAPIAWVLDRWLGGHHTFKRYTREELSALVDLQREDYAQKLSSRRPGAQGPWSSPAASGKGGNGASGAHHGGAKGGGQKELAGEGSGASQRAITVDEATIVAGVLSCHSKKIRDAMKPMDEVYALCEEDVLDENRLCEIMACGFSRIPVHSPRSRCDIRGFLLVKRLIVLDPEDKRPIKTLPLRQPIVVSPNGSLLELINVFQEGRSHMAIVSPCPDLTRQALRAGKPLDGRLAPIGIITLEDLFEEIIQEEIYDEMDARERKALETLRKIRRRVKRQRQQQREQQAAAAAAAANGGIPIPVHDAGSALSTPGTLSLASSPAGSLYSSSAAGTSPLPYPRLLAGLFGGGSSKQQQEGQQLLQQHHAHGNGHTSPLRPARGGYAPLVNGGSNGGAGGGDVEDGGEAGGGVTAHLMGGQPAPAAASSSSSSSLHLRGNKGMNGHGNGHGQPAPHGAPPPNYGSTAAASQSIRPKQKQQTTTPRDSSNLPV